jgi:hypothetical protein
MITNIFNKITSYIESWFNGKKGFGMYTMFNTLEMMVANLASNLYFGWQADYKMNSSDRDIVYKGTKEGIESNTERNKLLEQIEQYFASIQKSGGEPTTESLAMCLDKAIILYMKIINSKDEVKKKLLQNQLDFVLKSADKLFEDIVSGKKEIIVFSHLKDYML